MTSKCSLLIITILIIFTAGCDQKPTREELQNQVTEAETRLYQTEDEEDGSASFDQAAIHSTVDAYMKFAETYPKDSLAPIYLFKAGDLNRYLGEPQKALDLFERVHTDYSNYDQAPRALFLQGFVYENELIDLDKAKEKYELFLVEYPQHELAEAAQFSLTYLGRSPEDMIREFEQRQQPTQPHLNDEPLTPAPGAPSDINDAMDGEVI